MADDCELAYFGNLDRDGNGDYDGDGISDRDECANGTSPMGIEVQLSRGLNLFGYPLQIPVGYTSYNLIASIGNENEVDKIQRYNPATKVFETTSYLNGIASGDEFAINNGEGYYVYMKNEKAIAFNGVFVCPAVNLVPGLNIVSVPCTSPDVTAYDLLLYLGSPDDVISVQGFNANTGMFESTTYYNGQPSGAEFKIKNGAAYLIYMKVPKILSSPLP